MIRTADLWMLTTNEFQITSVQNVQKHFQPTRRFFTTPDMAPRVGDFQKIINVENALTGKEQASPKSNTT